MTSRKTYIYETLDLWNRKVNSQRGVTTKLIKGEWIWQRNGSVVVGNWQKKCDINTISSMHMVEMSEVHNQNGKSSQKPYLIKDYNEGMSGIDQLDQMLSYYSDSRKIIGWPKKLAAHIE